MAAAAPAPAAVRYHPSLVDSSGRARVHGVAHREVHGLNAFLTRSISGHREPRPRRETRRLSPDFVAAAALFLRSPLLLARGPQEVEFGQLLPDASQVGEPRPRLDGLRDPGKRDDPVLLERQIQGAVILDEEVPLPPERPDEVLVPAAVLLGPREDGVEPLLRPGAVLQRPVELVVDLLAALPQQPVVAVVDVAGTEEPLLEYPRPRQERPEALVGVGRPELRHDARHVLDHDGVRLWWWW